MSSVLLSAQEVHALKRMCNDPFLELGMILRPRHLACFKPKIATSSMRLIILFKEDADVEKWNSMHAEHLKSGAQLASITLTVLVSLLSRHSVFAAGNSAAQAVLKDEVPESRGYPQMSKNWVLIRHFTFKYEQFPGTNFYMAWTDIIKDDTGKEQARHQHGPSHCCVGGHFGIPEKLVRELMTLIPRCTTMRFQ